MANIMDFFGPQQQIPLAPMGMRTANIGARPLGDLNDPLDANLQHMLRQKVYGRQQVPYMLPGPQGALIPDMQQQIPMAQGQTMPVPPAQYSGVSGNWGGNPGGHSGGWENTGGPDFIPRPQMAPQQAPVPPQVAKMNLPGAKPSQMAKQASGAAVNAGRQPSLMDKYQGVVDATKKKRQGQIDRDTDRMAALSNFNPPADFSGLFNYINAQTGSNFKQPKTETAQDRIKVMQGLQNAIDTNAFGMSQDQLGMIKMGLDTEKNKEIRREKAEKKIADATSKQLTRDEKQVNTAQLTLMGLKRASRQEMGMLLTRERLAKDGLMLLGRVKARNTKGSRIIAEELAILMGSMLQSGNSPAMQTIAHLVPQTMEGKIAGIKEFLTGNPQSFLTSGMLEQFEDQLTVQKDFYGQEANVKSGGLLSTLTEVGKRNPHLIDNFKRTMEIVGREYETAAGAEEKRKASGMGGHGDKTKDKTKNGYIPASNISERRKQLLRL